MPAHQNKNNDEFRPQVGDYVRDCRDQILRVKEIDYDDDYAVLEDDFSCSIFHCLERP